MSRQARNWWFTVNNPVVEDPTTWGGSYGVYQLEQGESETPHYQGVIHFDKPQRLSALKKKCPVAHWEPTRNLQASIDYCQKEEGRLAEPITWGDLPQPGKRNDLVALKEDIDSGASARDLWDSHFSTMMRYHKAAATYKRVTTPPRTTQTLCSVYHGATATGKTTTVKELYPDAYYHNGSKWWDDYDGQEVVVIEEFYGQFPFSFMLKLLDHSPLKVEGKGTTYEFVSKHVVITSNSHPRSWWSKAEVPELARAALARRFTHIYSRPSWRDAWDEEGAAGTAAPPPLPELAAHLRADNILLSDIEELLEEITTPLRESAPRTESGRALAPDVGERYGDNPST